MGTFLRCAGGLGFLATLFLPAVCGLGLTDYSQLQLAALDGSAAAAGLFLAALFFGAFALAGPFFVKRPTLLSEGGVLLSAAAFAAGAAIFAREAAGRGGRLLWPVEAQFAALALVFAGALLRLRRR